MVNLGKLNCDEFAMGSSNENSYFGPVRNPWDTRAVPGGSSGGSRRRSGRTPDACRHSNGYRRFHPPAIRFLWRHRDQADLWPCFPVRHDCLRFIAGPGRPDRQNGRRLRPVAKRNDRIRSEGSTSLEKNAEDYTRDLNNPLNGLRIGVPREYFSEGLSPEVEQPIRDALTEFEKLGAKLVDISLKNTSLCIPVYYVIAPAEASSNLSRFDGVRYGFRAENYTDLQDMYRKTRSEGFGEEVQRRILVGTYVLSHGYYDAYYIQAQKIRRLIAEDYENAFAGCDVIMGPVSPTVAWNLGDKADDPVANYLGDIFTLSTNLAGLPGHVHSMRIRAG